MTSQVELVKEFFEKNPHREITTSEAVDWLVAEFEKRTGKIFRDPDRAIRKASQKGFLVKIKKGVYKYDPELKHKKKLEDFTPQQKAEILKRDGYKCVICGLGKENGVELQVDHIKPKDKGGKAELSNGQTLCGKHNYLKKNFSQTETGKKFYIRLLELAKKEDDTQLVEFCTDILNTFEKHNINGHIVWKN